MNRFRLLLAGLLVVTISWATQPSQAGQVIRIVARWDLLPATVHASPDVRVDVAAAIAPWNRLARHTILSQTADPHADIVFVADTSTWVDWTYRDGRMLSVRIHVGARNDTATLQHELGHGLGLADHIPANFLDKGLPGYPRWRTDTPVCDRKDHPNYVAYRGVMSYCQYGAAWWGSGDATLLESAGYRDPASTPTPRVRRTPKPRR